MRAASAAAACCAASVASEVFGAELSAWIVTDALITAVTLCASVPRIVNV